MASKYAHVINALPKMAGEEPAYQDKVNAVKAKMLEEMPRHASAFAQKYRELRNGTGRDLSDKEIDQLIERIGKAGIEDLLSRCNLYLTAVEQLTVDQYEVEGVNFIRLEEGSVAVQVEPYATVENHELYHQWCLAEGLLPMMALPWATTNKLAKDRLLNGEEPPPGVGIYAKSKIVVRKA